MSGPSPSRWERIHLGRIDKVHTGIERHIELFIALRLRVLLAPCHAAKANDTHFKVGTSESAIFHLDRHLLRSKLGQVR